VDEAAWLERARGGDREAFRRIVERYRDPAYALALRIVGSAPDAEEAAQDAFVRVWRALPQFRGESRFSTWLYRVVVRCAYDTAARRRHRADREEPLETESGGPREASVAPPDPAAAERERRVARLLEHLTEVQRAVVTLYYYEDLSVDEVARALELPEGTVKTHLHRARAALRDAWRREERTAMGSDG
jgi:RNA polymerase sigma-70 factor, ECF subfamily